MGRSALHLDIAAQDPYFSKMSSKICMGLFLILTAVVLGSADEKSQDQDLSTFSRVAREAENSNSKKGINVSKRDKAKNGKIKKGRKRHESKTKVINRNKNKTSKKNKKKREKRNRKKQKKKKKKKEKKEEKEKNN